MQHPPAHTKKNKSDIFFAASPRFAARPFVGREVPSLLRRRKCGTNSLPSSQSCELAEDSCGKSSG